MNGSQQLNRFQGLGWALHGVGLLVVFAMLCATYWGIIQSISNENRKLQDQGSALRAILETKTDLIAEKKRVEELLQARNDRLQELLARIPATPNESNFLEQLTQLSRSSGLRIRQFRPGDLQEFADYSSIQIELVGEGNFEAICRFLHGLPQLSRLSEVFNLKIRSTEASSGIYPITITLNIFYAPLLDSPGTVTEHNHGIAAPANS